MRSPYKLTASLICGDPLTLRRDIKALEAGGIDALHFDVMDGVFVPRYGLHPEMLRAVKSATKLPVDVHLMVEEPQRHSEVFLDAGADILVVHAEATRHLDHTIRRIKAMGGRVGVALNPATPLFALEYVLADIDLVMLMAINPGILGHKLIPGMLQKIRDLKEKLSGYPHIEIEIDGGVSPESAATMVRCGATMLACGTSSIYKKGKDLAQTTREFRRHIDKELAKSPLHV